MEGTACGASVKPFGEALDVWRIAENGPAKLEDLGGGHPFEHQVLAMSAQGDEAWSVSRLEPRRLRYHDQERVLRCGHRQGNQQAEAVVVGVVDVVDLEEQRLGPTDLDEPLVDASPIARAERP